MRLNPILLVMPDRPDAQIGFMDTESRLGFTQLNVGPPQLLIRPLLDVTAQDVSAFGEFAPLVPFSFNIPRKLEFRWAGLICA